MGHHQKTLALIEAARGVLEEFHPVTLRQLYYKLVAKQIIENKRSKYQRLSSAIVTARKTGVILWDY